MYAPSPRKVVTSTCRRPGGTPVPASATADDGDDADDADDDTSVTTVTVPCCSPVGMA